ncbi:hypothetical protein O9929_01870 [Vibrio lentus]|nr:hypothetical protein [Vibrio lentus]
MIGITPMEGIMVSRNVMISRLVAQSGQMLLATRRREHTGRGDIMRRIGIACGVNEVEVALSANVLVVTTGNG